MGQDINPCRPGVRQDGEDHLTRIEDRRGRVPQQRHPGVLLGLPERPPPLVPRRLNAFIQPVIIFADIAIGELLIPKQHRRVTRQEQRLQNRKGSGSRSNADASKPSDEPRPRVPSPPFRSGACGKPRKQRAAPGLARSRRRGPDDITMLPSMTVGVDVGAGRRHSTTDRSRSPLSGLNRFILARSQPHAAPAEGRAKRPLCACVSIIRPRNTPGWLRHDAPGLFAPITTLDERSVSRCVPSAGADPRGYGGPVP